MKNLFLLATCLGSSLSVADVYITAEKANANSLIADIRIHSKSEAECTQKFNELVQKIEITNRIILDTIACKYQQSDSTYRAEIFVATI